MSQSESFPPMGGDSASQSTGKSGSKSAKTIAGPRRVRLSLTRVDPWSIMKVSFMLSVAAGIMFVVAAIFVWYMLDALHVFSTIKELAGTVLDSKTNNAYTALLEYLKLSRAISMATIIAVINIILTTALSTIGALLYNVTGAFVGGGAALTTVWTLADVLLGAGALINLVALVLLSRWARGALRDWEAQRAEVAAGVRDTGSVRFLATGNPHLPGPLPGGVWDAGAGGATISS